MIILDLSEGFTETIVLKALFSLEIKTNEILSKIITADFFSDINFYSAVSELVRNLNGSGNIDLKAFSGTILYDDILKNSGEFRPIMESIIKSISIRKFVLNDFFFCLLIVIFMEKIFSNVTTIKATIPRIGIKTSSDTLRLFKDQEIILDVKSYSIYPISASAILHYFKPFLTVNACIINLIQEITDPFDQSCKIRLFDIDDVYDKKNRDNESRDIISVLQTNIDDCTSEIISDAMKKIMSAGALDYTITPATMKKGRQGFTIEVLCDQIITDKMIELLLKLTSTFGIRKYIVERVKLKRIQRDYNSSYGKIRIKEGYFGEKIMKITPEFDDIVKLGEENSISPYMLYQKIMSELNNFL